MNHSKRGFTLIELLAVIVVLGIILVIAIPKITESINNSKIAAFEDQKKIMLKVARDYIQIHGDDDGTNDGILTYDFLKSKNLLKAGIKTDNGVVLDDNTLIDTINNRILYLPYSFTQVEYIEGTGTQYIDTGVAFNSTYKKIIDYQMTTDQTNNSPFGARVTWDTYSEYIVHAVSGGVYSVRFVRNNQVLTFDGISYLTQRHKVIIDNGYLDFDGVSRTYTNSNQTNQYNYYLFATNNAGSVIFASPSKIYMMQILNGSTLIRNFVPCYRKIDNVVGMYDIVNSVFYTNAGTGEFLYGE